MTRFLLIPLLVGVSLFANSPDALKEKEDAVNAKIQSIMNAGHNNANTQVETLDTNCDKYLAIIAQKNQEIAELKARLEVPTQVKKDTKHQEVERESSIDLENKIIVTDKPKP